MDKKRKEGIYLNLFFLLINATLTGLFLFFLLESEKNIKCYSDGDIVSTNAADMKEPVDVSFYFEVLIIMFLSVAAIGVLRDLIAIFSLLSVCNFCNKLNLFLMTF